jgi:hypothetical protein
VGAHLLIAFLCLPLLAAIDWSAAATSQAWRGPMGVAGSVRNLIEFPLVTIHGLYFYPWDLYPAVVDHWHRSLVVRLVIVFPLLILALVASLAYPPVRAWRGASRVLYLALLIPLAVGTLVSIRSELSLTRYLLFATPYLCLVIAAGVVRAPRWVGVPALAIMLVAAAYGLVQYQAVGARDSDYRGVARALLQSASPTDAVVIQPPEAGVQLAYYLRHERLALWGLRAGAAIDSVLHPDVGARTWIALDYRSRWYRTPPESVATRLPGTVVSDRLEGAGDQRVRVLQVRDASPTPLARGLSDTTAVCCNTTGH